MPYHLERELFVARPREKVFAFFAEAANLERITPPFLRFHMLTPPPIEMRAGTKIDYELRLYGVRFQWRTLIEAFEPPSFFIDTQLSGPYRWWHHRHEFAEVLDGTQMWDRVEYELSFGPIDGLANALFVRKSVERVFDYRNATIARIFSR
jgi:ligand-binding SRPBCC domain-containing protein